MRVTISLSRQQEQLLLAVLETRSPPAPALEQLMAAAFDDYCENHPEECGDCPGAG